MKKVKAKLSLFKRYNVKEWYQRSGNLSLNPVDAVETLKEDTPNRYNHDTKFKNNTLEYPENSSNNSSEKNGAMERTTCKINKNASRATFVFSVKSL
ncbi:unnamed protein product [Ambrosiozyma monospora]|uniref:Unnamed protein product n=1 Tax=Ambrosiozyma monospora TaxID=43982 RepID=A0ACB5SWP8_AMBMO|nr:unnamed protein product [Ambrosiozyma monospora]